MLFTATEKVLVLCSAISRLLCKLHVIRACYYNSISILYTYVYVHIVQVFITCVGLICIHIPHVYTCICIYACSYTFLSPSSRMI